MNNPLLWWLTALQVLLPVGAALWAGITLLLNSHALKRERVIRERIRALTLKMYPDLAQNEADRERLTLLLDEFSKLPAPLRNKYSDSYIDRRMSAQPLEGYQVRNQYILLGAAVVSLALWPLQQAVLASS